MFKIGEFGHILCYFLRPRRTISEGSVLARLSIIASFLSSILIQVAALSEFAYHCDYYSLPDLPTERFPERVFQLSLYEILFLLWLLSIHPKLKNEIAKCEVQTGERQNQNYASSFNISY